MSDWIKWHGETADAPVSANVCVDVMLRDGSKNDGEAGAFNWRWQGMASWDIVSYRVVAPRGAEPAHSSVDAMLIERGKRYGEFTGHARITQMLKEEFRAEDNWNIMKPDQRECLDMIAHKLGRILNGDPHYYDSWKDIAGYAKLVSDRLEKEHGA